MTTCPKCSGTDIGGSTGMMFGDGAYVKTDTFKCYGCGYVLLLRRDLDTDEDDEEDDDE